MKVRTGEWTSYYNLLSRDQLVSTKQWKCNILKKVQLGSANVIDQFEKAQEPSFITEQSLLDQDSTEVFKSMSSVFMLGHAHHIGKKRVNISKE